MAYCYNADGERSAKANEVILNDFRIKERVIAIKISHNHSFGIVMLQLDSLNVGRFVDTPLVNNIYPYKVESKIAEVYINIPDGVDKEDEAIVDSEKKNGIFSLQDREHPF